MTLGEKIQKHRKEKRMSQEDLAALLGVSRQAVSKWELNDTIPDTENVIQLGRILGVSLDYLLIPERESHDECGKTGPENQTGREKEEEPWWDGASTWRL